MNFSLNSLKKFWLTKVPLILALEDDWVISLVKIISSVRSIPFSSNKSFKSCFVFEIVSSTVALSEPFFMTSEPAFAPKAMSIALIKILLPAPVSPVITFNPFEKSTVKSSINM